MYRISIKGITPATLESTSQVTSARSGFSPLARNPPYKPAALNPLAAVTPPGIYAIATGNKTIIN